MRRLVPATRPKRVLSGGLGAPEARHAIRRAQGPRGEEGGVGPLPRRGRAPPGPPEPPPAERPARPLPRRGPVLRPGPRRSLGTLGLRWSEGWRLTPTSWTLFWDIFAISCIIGAALHCCPMSQHNANSIGMKTIYLKANLRQLITKKRNVLHRCSRSSESNDLVPKGLAHYLWSVGEEFGLEFYLQTWNLLENLIFLGRFEP